jgi:hypothetical protein
MSREVREWYHRTRRGARSRCFNSSGLGISFCFVNVDGNGVLHYSSSPKSNRQGSLFSFLLPKSFALFVALVSRGCRRRRRFAALLLLLLLLFNVRFFFVFNSFFLFFFLFNLLSPRLTSVLFSSVAPPAAAKEVEKRFSSSPMKKKSKAYNNFLMYAPLSLSLSLSLPVEKRRRGGE